jgi:hypothetical protein
MTGVHVRRLDRRPLRRCAVDDCPQLWRAAQCPGHAAARGPPTRVQLLQNLKTRIAGNA